MAQGSRSAVLHQWMIMPNRFQNHGSSDDGSRQRRGAPLRRRGLAHLEVGDERFNSNEIERLYEAIRKPERPSASYAALKQRD